ncbi:hypothetical protein ABH37_12835 [Mycobacterium haemophilum]|uniref:Uncharacterized protein n=1 Tax=Mycobacterium haemophilum TaxID=29311 RepID=A0A0I9U1F0_9MYCO|nr:hypothetical protein ABH39_11695 [Mycobacterium haemophilum]KLO35909.1 hypothetical protein ABH38_13535 [Mycobacterium haemophilum]KLO41467.1 hypothetical protein ABH37_12835 [Mycobacterium haemophilum]KLO49347.1 hypothetical protein ABH36_12095 [Mycobacterium haemophilum]
MFECYVDAPPHAMAQPASVEESPTVDKSCGSDELHRYFLFCSERQVGRARAWLAAAGYTPVTPARCSNRSV